MASSPSVPVTNLSTISSLSTAALALSNLVLATPNTTQGYQPQNANTADPNSPTAQQPPALLFHYEGENSVVIESDITDHYIEDNTAIQDQIALKPEIVNTDGYIGELNDISPPALKPLLQAAQKLTVIDAYTPVLSATAILAYNEAFQAYQTSQTATQAAVSAWSSIGSAGQGGENTIGSSGLGASVFSQSTGQVKNNQNKQQTAFQQFYGYWRSRTLFTVQTPWAIFQNMAISRLQAIQDEMTRVISDFKVTFKMMRFSSTSSTVGNAPILQARASTQGASLVDLGTTTPTPSITLDQGLATL